ncbi:jg18817, partial [Pararge aegeria aegeria]
KHPDSEKHSCSSHKHLPVVGIEPTATESESRVAAHCASRPPNPHVPVTTPATMSFSPEHRIANMWRGAEVTMAAV